MMGKDEVKQSKWIWGQDSSGEVNEIKDAVFVAKIELEVVPVYVWMAERNQQ